MKNSVKNCILHYMNKKTDIIKSVAIDILPECRVILFGSRARNTHEADSDFDVLLISKKTLPIHEKRDLKAQLRKLLAIQGIPTDIVIQSEAEVKHKSQITGHLVKTIVGEGVAL